MSSFFGGDVEFGADVDQVTFSRSILDIAVVSADPYLNKLLIRQYEDVLAHRKLNRNAFALRVENAIVPLLPHGKANSKDVAQKLGMSQRTLARHLASEGLTFVGMLKELRMDLAKRDLADRDLSITKIAWLLGYQEASAFTNAFKRWTGDDTPCSPSRARRKVDGFRCRVVLTRSCPLWVRSRHFVTTAQCPLFPRKRTCIAAIGTSTLCQDQTHGTAANKRQSKTDAGEFSLGVRVGCRASAHSHHSPQPSRSSPLRPAHRR